MISSQQQASIRALGRIEGFKEELERLGQTLESAPLWRPGRSLKTECSQVQRMMADLEKRFDRKLVVTLIGPCGSGKSTLLNALADVDRLSETGHHRPTTRHLIVLCQKRGDAKQLTEYLGEDQVEIRSSFSADALENVLLIDTPDPDSSEGQSHIPLLNEAIALSDVLLCVFDGENPKRMDYADFLAPYIRRFHGESLLCALNKCDRLSREELETTILPEFSQYLKGAWTRPPSRVLCISARANLKQPDWDPKAAPKHGFDQFGELKELLFGKFNQAGYAVDRRLENARSLRDYAFEEVRSQAGQDREPLSEADGEIGRAEGEAVQNSLSALKRNDPKQLLGVNVLLYQKLAQHWLGPVGWLVAIWARIQIFGTGMVAMFRFGNPIRQIAGVASSLWHFKDSRSAVAEAGKSERVDAALRNYRLAIVQNWPDIAESLIMARFDSSVRDIDGVMPDSDALSQELSGLWTEALDESIEAAARRLSGGFLQMLFNIPALGIMGYVGWITASNFFTGHYFRADFFLHALLTIVLILFLSFFLLQIGVRFFASTDGIVARAFETVKAQAEAIRPASLNPVRKQVETVLGLAGTVQKAKGQTMMEPEEAR